MRRWRTEVAGRGLRDAAADLQVSPSLWSAWENGSEAIATTRFEGVDRVLGGGSGLRSLLHATTTEAAFPSRDRWSLHRAGRSRPWWLYVRGPRFDPTAEAGPTSAATPTVDFSWGPVELRGLAVAPHGTVVLVPVSVANPALDVTFRDATGWVDAGNGPVPGALGLDVVHGVHHIVTPTVDLATQVVARWIRQLGAGRQGWDDVVVRFFGGAPFITQALASADHPKPLQINRDLRTVSGTAFRRPAGPDFVRARNGRRRPRPAVAEVATAMDPHHPVSEDQLKRLESTDEPGTGPVVPLLRARLDRIYDGDGHLGDGVMPSEQVPTRTLGAADGTSRHQVRFPDWWVGPVWFRFDLADGRLVTASLRWGLWTRDVLVESGQAVWARRAEPGYPDPVISIPSKARLVAGLGRVDGAVDVNRHWDLTGERARRRLLREYVPLYLTTFGKSPDEAARTIRAFGRGRP